MDSAIEEALQAMYEQKNIYDGYDPDGYLQCFEAEMKNRAIPKRCMIQVFAELVIPELQESIRAYATRFADNWEKFAKAIVKVGDDHMDKEIERLRFQRRLLEEHDQFGLDTGLYKIRRQSLTYFPWYP